MRSHSSRLFLSSLLVVLALALLATGCSKKADEVAPVVDSGPQWKPDKLEVTITPPVAPATAYTVSGNPHTHRLKRDIVRWYNSSAVMVTITFPDWPFEDSPHDILVPAHGTTGWFVIKDDPAHHGNTKEFPYTGVPVLKTGGPGDPGVIVED